jgi:hypothetical protein
MAADIFAVDIDNKRITAIPSPSRYQPLVRWLDDETYIDEYGETHHYNKLDHMREYYTNLILENAAAGLKDRAIQQLAEELPNGHDIEVSITRIREIIQEVCTMNEEELLSLSERRRAWRAIILRLRRSGRPSNDQYDDEIEQLLLEDTSPNQIAKLFKEKGYDISRATVFNRAKRIIKEKGYQVERV